MGKSILITGADRGLGSALVEQFLQGNYRVFAGQFMPDWGELGALQEKYPQALTVVPLDVGDLSSVKKAAALVESEAGGLDMLVNNAGISGGAGDITGLSGLEKAQAIFNINCLGPLRMVNTFLPLMEQPGGEKRICFVSSESGSVSVCHRTDGFIYPMSKTALNRMVKLLFTELQPQGYTFRLFHPGWVKSYMSGEKSTIGKFEPEESAASGYAYFTENFQREDVLRLVDNEGAAWPY